MITRALLLVFGLFLLVSPMHAQDNPQLADQFQLYSCYWTGSITGGTAFSVSVPQATAANRHVYPVGVTIVPTAAVTITVRTRATTEPTSTVLAPVWLSASEDPPFNCYTTSNVNNGDIVTAYDASAGEAVYIPLTIKYGKGSQTKRNTTVHLSASSGATAKITWKIGTKN